MTPTTRPLSSELRTPPALDPDFRPDSVHPRYALLINPFYRKDPHSSFGKHVLTPSLALTTIAAATPPDWWVGFWDENLLQGPPPCRPFPQVVGITVHLTFARRAYALAKWYRERGATVVLGGPHIVSCPEEAAPHADVLAVGEGVQTWPKILKDLENNCLQRIYHGSYDCGFRSDPTPWRELLPRNGFLTSASLLATRGCHNRCGFCHLSTEGLHMPYRCKDPEQVAREFRKLNRPYGVFLDNNLGSRPEYLRRLCRALKPLRKIWSAAVSLEAALDPSLVREMALSGCTGVFIGFETVNLQNLVDARKKSPRPDQYASLVEVFHDHGVQVNGSFVFGFDHDRPDVFERTVAWIERVRLECATFHILTPYPGTPLFRRLEAEGRILHRNWDLYDTSQVVFQPKHMTPRQLREGYVWSYERLFSHRSIWKRRPGKLGAAISYLAMSYLYKKCNPLWHALIRHRLTAAVWAPLVEFSRWRHLRFRKQLERSPAAETAVSTGSACPEPGAG